MAGGRLNGYAVPVAVVAVGVSLIGLLIMDSCSRLAELDTAVASELTWRTGHEAIDSIYIKQIESLAADVDTIKRSTLKLEIRQELVLKTLGEIKADGKRR